MKLTAEREKLLAPLQAVIGVVERRQTMPVLANVLLGVRRGTAGHHRNGFGGRTGGRDRGAVQEAGDITVPGRKFLDILRSLCRETVGVPAVEGEKVVIKAGRSRFSLSTCRHRTFP
jgi:DNA polymerase-3 subunit beta